MKERLIELPPAQQRLAQEVAADVLMEFIFARTMEDVDKAYKNVFKRYGLCYDPFTNTPCSPAEYDECKEEWNRQMMENKYGYSE